MRRRRDIPDSCQSPSGSGKTPARASRRRRAFALANAAIDLEAVVAAAALEGAAVVGVPVERDTLIGATLIAQDGYA